MVGQLRVLLDALADLGVLEHVDAVESCTPQAFRICTRGRGEAALRETAACPSCRARPGGRSTCCLIVLCASMCVPRILDGMVGILALAAPTVMRSPDAPVIDCHRLHERVRRPARASPRSSAERRVRRASSDTWPTSIRTSTSGPRCAPISAIRPASTFWMLMRWALERDRDVARADAHAHRLADQGVDVGA